MSGSNTSSPGWMTSQSAGSSPSPAPGARPAQRSERGAAWRMTSGVSVSRIREQICSPRASRGLARARHDGPPRQRRVSRRGGGAARRPAATDPPFAHCASAGHAVMLQRARFSPPPPRPARTSTTGR